MEDQGIEKSNKLLNFILVETVLVYSIWPLFDEPIASKIFYIGIAFTQFLMALYIKQISKPQFITFFIFCVTLNNLLDELLFDPQKIGYNEYIATAIIIVVYLLKDKDPKSDA